MDGNAFWLNALANAFGSFLGGGILALLALWFSDFIFSVPELSGFWTLITDIEKSSYKKYVGLHVTFLLAIWQDEKRVYGTGEKVFERRSMTARMST